MELHRKICWCLHARIHSVYATPFPTQYFSPMSVCPHAWIKPTYGAKVQYAPNTDNSPVLSDTEIRHIQSVIGNLLYYALAVDPTILVAIRTVFRERSKATKNCRSMQLVDGLLCVKPLSHNSIHSFRYGTLHSEQRFLSLWIPGKESRGGTFFLSDIPNDSNTPPIEIPPLNISIYTSCKNLDVVVGLVAEAEIQATYHNAQEDFSIVTTSEELIHPQPPTPLQVNNTTAGGYSNETINPKHSKSTGKLYHWVHDCLRQKQVLLYFCPCITNLAD